MWPAVDADHDYKKRKQQTCFLRLRVKQVTFTKASASTITYAFHAPPLFISGIVLAL